jgi:hypothetical protein
MTSASKAKGSRWEAAIVDHLRASGVPHAERRLAGSSKDRGDIAGVPGVVFEAKADDRMSLGAWLAEAEVERVNDGAALAVVWHKRRGRAAAGEGFITMTPATLLRLLVAAGYIDDPAAARAAITKGAP